MTLESSFWFMTAFESVCDIADMKNKFWCSVKSGNHEIFSSFVTITLMCRTYSELLLLISALCVQ